MIFLLLLLICWEIAMQSKIDLKWDEEMQRIDPDLKCGIENKYKQLAKSRIINGIETSNIKYPWMVEIVHITRNVLPNGKFVGTRCGGTIVSDKSILTAGHCVCIPHSDKKRDPTCLEDSNGPQNQNRPENYVHYTFGSMRAVKRYTKLKFNKDIKAFLHNYDSTWWTNSPKKEKKKRLSNWKNGDAAVIMNENGLNLKSNQAIPICLPSPDIFENDLEVTLIGRGEMYEECPPTAKSIPSSCMTNGERIHKAVPNNAEFKFMPCKNYRRENHGGNCFSIANARTSKGDKVESGYKKGLISTDLKITFSGNPGDISHQMEIVIPQDDKCEELSDELMKQLKYSEKGDLELSIDDVKFPSRIVVFEIDHPKEDIDSIYLSWEKLPISNRHTYCYNIKTVAEFGVCETELTRPLSLILKKQVVINFGFCGPSCQNPNMHELYVNHYSQFKAFNRHQWKMEAIYHENYDADDGFTKKYGLNLNYYKCLTVKHPTSYIAIFTKDQNGQLKYRGNRKDKSGNNPSNSQKLFLPYQASGPGDSGSPWSTTIDVDVSDDDASDDDEPSTSKKRRKIPEKRHVIVGIHSRGDNKASCAKPKKMTSCIQKTTKLTEDIVAWIKSM